MKKEIIFEDKHNAIFEQTTFKTRRKVVVRNKNDKNIIFRTYRFNITDTSIESPYISWENLNQCNGWSACKEYSKSAVQKGKKLCATISFDNLNELEHYANNLPDTCDCYWIERDGYRRKFFYAWIYRKGCLSDFYCINEILKHYKKHDIYLNESNLKKLMATNISVLIKCDFTYIANNHPPYDRVYDVVNPLFEEEIAATGLLFGYPIESTASLITE